MSNELIEKIARAICDWQQPGSYDELASLPAISSSELHQEHYRIMARAVIAILSKPENISDEMCGAFEHAYYPYLATERARAQAVIVKNKTELEHMRHALAAAFSTIGR